MYVQNVKLYVQNALNGLFMRKEAKAKRVNLRITEEEYFLWNAHCPQPLSAYIRKVINEKVNAIARNKEFQDRFRKYEESES